LVCCFDHCLSTPGLARKSVEAESAGSLAGDQPLFSTPKGASKRMDITEAIQALTSAGAVFSVPQKHLSLGAAAKKLDCSVKWVRTHKQEFPNAWRMPGGELRIPERDVEALAERNKLRRAA
jgi:hypothetical protein